MWERRREEAGKRPGIANQKQEPHTKLWGKIIVVLSSNTCLMVASPSRNGQSSTGSPAMYRCCWSADRRPQYSFDKWLTSQSLCWLVSKTSSVFFLCCAARAAFGTPGAASRAFSNKVSFTGAQVNNWFNKWRSPRDFSWDRGMNQDASAERNGS